MSVSLSLPRLPLSLFLALLCLCLCQKFAHNLPQPAARCPLPVARRRGPSACHLLCLIKNVLTSLQRKRFLSASVDFILSLPHMSRPLYHSPLGISKLMWLVRKFDLDLYRWHFQHVHAKLPPPFSLSHSPSRWLGKLLMAHYIMR